MNRTLKSLFVGMILAGVAESQAQVVFTFVGTDSGSPTITKLVGGITLSASNPNTTSGNFAVDDQGLYISGDASYAHTSFQFSFDTPVQITHFGIGLAATTGTFDLSATGGGSSTGNDMTALGNFALNGTFNVAANEVITFTSTVGFSDLGQIQSFTAVSAVPEPAETTALAAGVCGLVAFAARRRLGRASAV